MPSGKQAFGRAAVPEIAPQNAGAGLSYTVFSANRLPLGGEHGGGGQSEQARHVALDVAVAFASVPFELLPPDDLYVAAMAIDRAGFLQPSSRQVDRRALHAEHLR